MVDKVNDVYEVNKEILELSKDVTKITKQMDELKADLDKEMIEKAEQSLQTRVSIKGENSPEDFAEKFRKKKLNNEKPK